MAETPQISDNQDFGLGANIKARAKLMCKSNLFGSCKGELNKDLRGRVTLGEEQVSVESVVNGI